ARLPKVEVCGKTGSSQLASSDYVKANSSAQHLKDNAWFVGFAPRQAPEIAVVAFFEHGEHGQFAAPIVRDVMKAYFDKKTRLTSSQQEPATAAKIASLLSFPTPSPQAVAPSPQSVPFQ